MERLVAHTRHDSPIMVRNTAMGIYLRTPMPPDWS